MFFLGNQHHWDAAVTLLTKAYLGSHKNTHRRPRRERRTVKCCADKWSNFHIKKHPKLFYLFELV